VDLRDDQTVWNDDELEAEIENFEMDFSDMSLDDFEW
jgi:hypothetical protein